ncbi:Uma2 family endonuclease [Tundrisphaera lichenicola]|uniref:Uma2 family endonuclease n=1 Tax=Tundrisphaera lichenicola TaxID=2029860 RepID=UPI003EB9E9DC
MASQSRTRSGMTLEEFLRWPEADEHPYKEFIDGRIEVKVSPQKKHSILTSDFCFALDTFARPLKLGRAFPELRCTFEGRSIVPDVVFLRPEHIERDSLGEFADETVSPPDIHIEIRSPGQSLKKTVERLEHSVANGCPLGWLVDPILKTIDVYRREPPPERLPNEGFLDGAPVLPGFRLPVAEVFRWLAFPEPAGPGADPA